MTSVAARLGRLHDGLTWLTFALAVLSLAVIIVTFCFEVVARYMFNAPTTWALALTSYLLCLMIFAALPEMTRTSSHIAITIVLDKLPAGPAASLRALINVLGVGACALATWITADEAFAHLVGNIWTIQSWPIPKWLVSGFIPYGFASAGLYFLRHLLRDPRLPAAEGVGV